MKKLLMMTFVIALIFSLAACGSSNNSSNGNVNSAANNSNTDSSSSGNEGTNASSKTDPVELTFLANVTDNLTVDFYQKLIDEFHQQNPSISVKLIHAPDGNTTNYAKTLLASGSFPDVMNNVDSQPFINAGALLDLTPDEDWKQIKDWQADAYWEDGKYYSFNQYVQPALLIYYNKKAFQDAGITDAPKTWDEFFAVCQKLKDKGYTPVELGGDWTSSYVFGEMVSPSVFGTRTSWFKDRYDGNVHFTDDYWVKATENYANIVKDGYANKGALSLPPDSMDAEFAKGKIGMYPMGSWTSASDVLLKSGLDIGVFLPPNDEGKALVPADRSGGLLISKTTVSADAAVKFAKFIELSPDAHKAFAKADSLISNLTNPVSYEMNPLQQQVFDTVAHADAVVGHYNGSVGGRKAVSGMYDAFGKVAQDILLGKADISKEMKYLDDTWETNQKKDEQTQQ